MVFAHAGAAPRKSRSWIERDLSSEGFAHSLHLRKWRLGRYRSARQCDCFALASGVSRTGRQLYRRVARILDTKCDRKLKPSWVTTTLAGLGLFLLAGLLIGHWVSQSKTPANTTVKIEGLGGLAAAGTGATATTAGTPSESTSSTGASTKTSAKQEAKEKAEREARDDRPLPRAFPPELWPLLEKA